MRSDAQEPSIRTSGLTREQAIARWPKPPRLERARVTAAGLRVLEGKYITIITDLPASPRIDSLVSFGDAAVEQLCKYFDLPPRVLDRWRVRACVISDQSPFVATGLVKAEQSGFPNGLSIGYEVWLRDQASDYYLRHLLLHEVTHSFMSTQLGGCGPGWYMEAMAELIGTHQWDARTNLLSLAVMPPSRDGFEMWGRTKRIEVALAEGEAFPLAAVTRIKNDRPLSVNQYSWCWALARLMDSHPRYQQRWRLLPQQVLDSEFNDKFYASMAEDWSHLDTEYRLFVTRADYGYDIKREAIDFEFGRPMMSPQGEVKLAVDRGWQSTGWLVEKGSRYKMMATGRFTIAHEPDGTPWPCEAGGVTIEYYGGQPLGRLLAVIDPRQPGQIARQRGTNAFLKPEPLGSDAVLEPRTTGTLYLRVNDSPNAVADNEGELRVEIRRLP